MRHIVRAWGAMAAFGAGLVHLAVAAGAPLPLMLAFALVGAAELVWAVMSLARARYQLPRAAPVLSLLPLLLWAGGLAAGVPTSVLPPLALAMAALLAITAAVLVAVDQRRAIAAEPAAEAGTARVLIGFAAGAFAMAALALPALGQTQAGIAASQGPHAHHSVDLDLPAGHDGH
jgi:hypothetical protein